MKAWGLNAQMVARLVAVGHRRGDPVDVEADQVEQLAAHDGDLRRIDAVGAENRASPAFRALKEVVPPLFQNIQGHGPGTAKPSQELSEGGKIVAVDGPEQFRTEHGHVLGVSGADEEMAFIGAGAAADANVHEDLKAPETVQPLLEPIMEDLLPVVRELPVVLEGIPRAGIGKPQRFDTLGVGRIAVHPRTDIDRGIHPVGFGHFMIQAF